MPWPFNPIKIILNDEQMKLRLIHGDTRHRESRKQSLQNRNGIESGPLSLMEADYLGAGGEIATSIAIGIGDYFIPTINMFKAPDLPYGIQVRTGHHHNCGLIVRPKDNPDDIFVCATADEEQREYLIHGWLYGHEAKTREYYKNDDGKDRPPYYLVSQSDLKDIDILIATVRILMEDLELA